MSNSFERGYLFGAKFALKTALNFIKTVNKDLAIELIENEIKRVQKEIEENEK